MNKKAFIADTLHYPITVSEIEKLILATPTLNRLHWVRQNSTAYLTFPNMTHARFAHSLGAMHIAGEIFCHGFLNANDLDVSEFSRFTQKICAVLGRQLNVDDWQSCANNDGTAPDALWQQLDVFKEFPEYRRLANLPRSEAPDERRAQIYALTVAYQAARIATLVHDLGHPPFSHVTERAMTDAGLEADSWPKDKTIKNAAYNRFVAAEFDREQPLHEALTSQLFLEVQAEVLENVDLEAAKKGNPKPSRIAFVYQIFELTKLLLLSTEKASFLKTAKITVSNREVEIGETNEILLGKLYGQDMLLGCRGVIGCLHDIKAGELDADRLDYVSRDLMQSGIKSGGLRLGRLIESMTLALCNVSIDASETLVPVPRIIPSIRAIRTLEEFFQDRLELYRTVIYHHHVVKTDLLLALCVKELLLERLATDTQTDNNQITSIIQGDTLDLYWSVFAPPEGLGKNSRQRLFALWSDAWLITELRREFNRLHTAEYFEAPAKAGHSKSRLKARLAELLSGNKLYKSCIKRMGDLQIFFDAFSVEFRKTTQITLAQLSSALAASTDDAEKDKLNRAADKIIHPLTGNHGRLSHVYAAFEDKLLSQPSDAALSRACEAVKEELGLDDVLATYCREKAAKSYLKVLREDAVCKFGDVSALPAAQKAIFAETPRLFVYMLPEISARRTGFPLERKTAFLTKFGCAFAIEFNKELIRKLHDPAVRLSEKSQER